MTKVQATVKTVNAMLATYGVAGQVSFKRTGAGKGWSFRDETTHRVIGILDPRQMNVPELMSHVTAQLDMADRLQAEIARRSDVA